MAKEDSRTLVWVGIGALAAVGTGYLLWRYALNEEQKERTREEVGKAVRKGRQLAEQGFSRAKTMAADGADKARVLAETGAVKARGMADEIGQRVRARTE